MKPGPALAQQLGPLGINIGKVISDVNTATSSYNGVKVPVQLDVDSKTKKYSIQVFSPPTAELIKKELSAEKGSGHAAKTKIGNLAIEQVIAIAKTKLPNMLAKDLKAAVKLVVGSCVSLGVLIEDKNAKEIEKDITSGLYDKEIHAGKTDISSEKKALLAKTFSSVKAKQEAEMKAEEAAKLAEEAAKAAVAATAPAASQAAGTPTAAGAAPTAAAAPAKADAKPEKPAKKDLKRK